MQPRVMTVRDRRYVVPTWGHSSKYDGLTKRQRFDLVDRILDGDAKCVVLAVDITVHAWACASADGCTLHYAYVPPELRGFGLARRAITHLLGSYPDHIDVSHEWPRASARFRFTPARIAA